ncbi:MAG: hypothetical protein EB060_07620, partial [Proteobacteria bacterium]|nr:hypothetical protein [Pseudomonadota bacterium]
MATFPQVTERHFRIMLGIAVVLHVIFLALLAAGFEPKTIEIPFRPIHLKLGNRPNPSAGAEQVNMDAPKTAPTPIARAPIMQA